MSWLDQLQTDFIITMGNGVPFYPLWINASKAVEYNISEFEFPELEGTLVQRGTAKGTRYNIEIYFQGEDHLDVSRSFELNGRDRRPWRITHPYYGQIIVQPLGLVFDNSDYNVTRINASVVETITQDAPRITQDPVDKISFDKDSLDDLSVNAFDIKPTAQDVNTLSTSNNAFYNSGSKKVKDPINAEEYFNAFSTASAAINNATAKPLAAIRTAQAVINAPSQFKSSVQNRIGLLVSQFATLLTMVKVSSSRSTKKIFESNGTTLVSSMTKAASTPLTGDYTNRASVLSVMEVMLETYNLFLKTLDDVQSENGGDLDSFIPDPSSMSALSDLIKYTVANLLQIAVSAKQERTIYLEDDTNMIVLCHRLVGLKEDDSTLDQFIEINNIGINEVLELKKGRKITYYV